jgi:hypothetical protein
MKLVELAMVQIVITMEDERCFSTLVVMKSKFHNRFITHLPLIVHMSTQNIHVIHFVW